MVAVVLDQFTPIHQATANVVCCRRRVYGCLLLLGRSTAAEAGTSSGDDTILRHVLTRSLARSPYYARRQRSRAR